MVDLLGSRASFSHASDRPLLEDRMRDDASGRRPEQADVNSPTFVLSLFLSATDPRDKRRVLEQHPELLSPEMEQFIEFGLGIIRERATPEMAESLDAHRLLLARCRQIGLDEAFAEWIARPPEGARVQAPAAAEPDQGAADELTFTVNLFLQAGTGSAKRHLVKQHPELLGHQTDLILAYWWETARAQGNEDAARLLDAHRRLLLRCRQVGVEAAFIEQRL